MHASKRLYDSRYQGVSCTDRIPCMEILVRHLDLMDVEKETHIMTVCASAKGRHSRSRQRTTTTGDKALNYTHFRESVSTYTGSVYIGREIHTIALSDKQSASLAKRLHDPAGRCHNRSIQGKFPIRNCNHVTNSSVRHRVRLCMVVVKISLPKKIRYNEYAIHLL